MLFACSPAMYRQEADDQVYSILEKVNAKVTGNATVFNLDRPVDTLRARLRVCVARRRLLNNTFPERRSLTLICRTPL